MKVVNIMKSDIENSDYDSVLTAIDIEAEDLEPGQERELRVVIINDQEVDDEQETETETESEEDKNG